MKKKNGQQFTFGKLTGDQLMGIKVGPLNLNFGKIFVKSTKDLYFQIRNESDTPIKAQVNIGNVLELKGSYLKP